MTSAELIVSIIATFIIMGGVIWLIVRRPPGDVKIKWFLIVLSVIFALAVNASLWGLSGIPSKAKTYMKSAAYSIEEYLNAASPDATIQPISSDNLRHLLDDRKRLETFIDENDHIGLIVDMIASRAFLNNVKAFCDGTEAMIDHFDATGHPLTIHNALEYIQSKADTVVSAKVAGAQYTLLIVMIVAFAIVLLLYFSACKGWFTTKTSNVTFGDEM